MNCEFCGSNIRGEPQAVNLDGGLFKVCNSCARLGTPARTPRNGSMRAPRPMHSFSRGPPRSNGPFARTRSPVPTHIPPPTPSGTTTDDEELELRQDYSRIIKEARESMGLSQEDLGRKINEKPSVISHLETGSMKPSDALARKLEHALKIELFLPPEDSFASEAETGPAGESGEPIQSV